VNSHDRQKGLNFKLACEEHVMGGQCIYIFSLIFCIFHKKIRKIQFCLDTNSHGLRAYNPAAVYVVNKRDLFHGQISQEATKPGLVWFC